VDPFSPTVAVDASVGCTHSLPRILSVGTLEGRKNHLALLQAAAALWDSGAQFELQLLGLARPDTAKAALDLIAALQRAGRPLVYGGSVTDETLHAAYRKCSFTVYPSLIEGFGLPVLESLQHGRPCICSGRGALAESAVGGGCIALNSVDGTSLATAIRSLLENPSELSTLATAARSRKLQTWNGYANAVLAWMKTLSRRT
jgi:glycosyltransferase involved in cell wall biosynthesis